MYQSTNEVRKKRILLPPLALKPYNQLEKASRQDYPKEANLEDLKDENQGSHRR